LKRAPGLGILYRPNGHHVVLILVRTRLLYIFCI
jgi:hypothetical protein